jgi:hypothetical protein
MANITDIERLNYYEGEYLGAVDFAAEQEYLRDMRRRHNVGQHTWGIVTGLNLVQVAASGTSGSTGPVDVYIQPGMAVDGFGREIVMLSETQLTTNLLAAYYNPSPQAQPQPMYVWIAYQQQFLQPSTDACTSQNTANPYGRIQESFQLVVTTSATPSPPPNDPLVVDGTDLTPPPEPSTLASPSTSSGATAPTLGPNSIVLPYDGSVPYQEFATDDTTVNWLIPLGQVQWDPYNQVFLTTAPKLAKSGRQYAGNVSATVYAPTGSLTIQDRFAPSPLPDDPTDAHYHGVRVEVLGSLKVDRLLRALHGAWIYEHWDLNFKNSDGQDGDTALWIRRYSNATGGADLHIHIGDGTNYKSTPQRLTIGYGSADGSADTLVMDMCANGAVDIPTGPLTFGTKTGPQNAQMLNFSTDQSYGIGLQPGTLFFRSALDFDWFVGGTYSATQDAPGTGGILAMQLDNSGDLSVNGGVNIDRTGSNSRGLNPGLTFGASSTAGIASNIKGATNQNGLDFYTDSAAQMSITQAGLVGIGTSSPQQNLSVQGGLNIDQADANNGTLPNGTPGPELTFGEGSGEGIGSQRTADANASVNQYGLDFYTDFVQRMSITQQGRVGIGTSGPQQNLSVQGGLNIDQANANNGTLPTNTPCPELTFGESSGEGIGSQRTANASPSVNRYGLDFYTDFAQRMSITQGGNVGIGTSAPGYLLDVNGSIASSGAKLFVIDHPLDPRGKRLAHATLEGPELAVFYRGHSHLSEGKATIVLPAYFEALTRKENRTVLLTPIFAPHGRVSQLAASEVQDGQFDVRKASNGNPSQAFYWEVKAVRADVELLTVEPAKTPGG